MRLKQFKWLLFVLILLLVGGYYWYSLNVDDGPKPMSHLAVMGNECDIISEKAALHLPEALPFQQLEKKARRTRVFEICMHDRGFVENPAWVKLIAPKVIQMAKVDNISENEAYETIRRKQMYEYEPIKNALLYWQTAKERIEPDS